MNDEQTGPAQPQVSGQQVSGVDQVMRLRRMFDDARTLQQEARLQSCVDRDYYDGHQLTAAELAILRARGQPELVINRVRRGVDGVLGIAEQARTDPRAYMRNPPDPGQNGPVPQGQLPGQPPAQPPPLDAADVATMTLRFISDVNHFKAIKQDVLEDGLIEGAGASIIECVDQRVTVTQIRWEEFFYDPRSRRADFGDARYMGVAKWMYADQVATIYPEKKQEIDNFSAGNAGMGLYAYDQSWEDRPQNVTPWIDLQQRRIIVAEIYFQEGGVWQRCVFYANGILEPIAPSPYQDDRKQPLCPIEAWSCYVDRQNRRYGIVRDMRGPQDEINMRRSKLLHLLNVRQIQPIDLNSPPVDANTVRAEAARPDGVIPPGWNIVNNAAVAEGQAELLTEAKNEIERLGPSPAILGRQGADASGRAVQLRQQAGLTEFARLLGRFSDWELRCYKQMWMRARQFWTSPKWVRVTNDEGAAKYIQINEPAGHQIQQDPQTGQPVAVPQFKNHIAKMDVDIVVDTVPETATLQQEIFNELVQLAQAYGPQAVPFNVLIELSPLPRKREIIDKLETAQAQAAQANAPAVQLKMSEAQANIAETQSITAKNNAQASLAETQTVTTALEGHLKATAAAQLPPGIMLDGSGQPVPLSPPPPGAIQTGAPGPSPVH